MCSSFANSLFKNEILQEKYLTGRAGIQIFVQGCHSGERFPRSKGRSNKVCFNTNVDIMILDTFFPILIIFSASLVFTSFFFGYVLKTSISEGTGNCNAYKLQHLQIATPAIFNTCNLHHLQFATCAIFTTCNWQHAQFPTCVISNQCNLHHM